MKLQINNRQVFTNNSLARDQGELLTGFEGVWIEAVARQQFIEVGAVTFRESRRLADVARRNLQDLRQVIPRELVACLRERGQLGAVVAE